ncbi:unnamed protein product [Rhodiola kirilowii]
MSSQPMSRAEGAGEQKADLEPDATPSYNGALIPNHAGVSLTPPQNSLLKNVWMKSPR